MTFDPGSPSGAILNSNTGVFGWVPGEAQGGNVFTITVRVTDNGNPPLSDARTFVISVLKTNSVPQLSVGGARVVNEGDVISFTATATDSDLPTQMLTFSLDPAGLPAGASINPSNGVFTWQPGEIHGPGA